jgi:hypothetical protein
VGGHVSVASKEVVCSKMAQNTVCFVNVADGGLRPKSWLPKPKTPAWMQGVLCLKMDYYPSNTIRWEILFVKKKEGGRDSLTQHGLES